MKIHSFLALAWVFAASGCLMQTSEGGGGIETGEVQARVVDSAGSPRPQILVWLVEDRGPWLEGKAVDSLRTDSDGRVRFHPGGTSVRWGLDALGEGQIAVGSSASDGETALLTLARPGLVETWIDSSRTIPHLVLRGSHFRGVRHPSLPKTELTLPRGRWTIGVVGSLQNSLALAEITAQPTVIGLPWSIRPLEWTDSLPVDLKAVQGPFFRDTVLFPPRTWKPLDSTVAGVVLDPSRSTLLPDSVSISTARIPLSGGGIESPTLPDTGAIRLSFGSPDAIRTMVLREVRGGSRLTVEVDPSRPTLRLVYDQGAIGDDPPVELAFAVADTSTWTLAWDSKYFYVMAGTTRVTTMYRSPPPLGGVQFLAWASPGDTGSPRAGLADLRLYLPH